MARLPGWNDNTIRIFINPGGSSHPRELWVSGGRQGSVCQTFTTLCGHMTQEIQIDQTAPSFSSPMRFFSFTGKLCWSQDRTKNWVFLVGKLALRWSYHSFFLSSYFLWCWNNFTLCVHHSLRSASMETLLTGVWRARVDTSSSVVLLIHFHASLFFYFSIWCFSKTLHTFSYLS